MRIRAGRLLLAAGLVPRFRGIADPRHGDAGLSMALQQAEWRRLIAEITACR